MTSRALPTDRLHAIDLEFEIGCLIAITASDRPLPMQSCVQLIWQGSCRKSGD